MINDGCWKNKDLQFRVFAIYFVGGVHIRSRGIFPPRREWKSFASKFCKEVLQASLGCQSRIGCGGDNWSSRWLQAHYQHSPRLDIPQLLFYIWPISFNKDDEVFSAFYPSFRIPPDHNEYRDHSIMLWDGGCSSAATRLIYYLHHKNRLN